MGTYKSNHLSITDPHNQFPQALLVHITSPDSALSTFPGPALSTFPGPALYLGTAAYWAIGGAARDTLVQTLTHHAGAPTPEFPDMVHEAPLFTALTRLCLAPGKGDMVTAPGEGSSRKATSALLGGQRAFLGFWLSVIKLRKSWVNVWSRYNPTLPLFLKDQPEQTQENRGGSTLGQQCR